MVTVTEDRSRRLRYRCRPLAFPIDNMSRQGEAVHRTAPVRVRELAPAHSRAASRGPGSVRTFTRFRPSPNSTTLFVVTSTELVQTGERIHIGTRGSTLRHRAAAGGRVLAILIVGIILGRTVLSPEPTPIWQVADAWDIIHDEYVDPDHLDDAALVHGAIAGMADAVGDTDHTYFLSPAEAAEYALYDAGRYVGIGVEFRSNAEPNAITSVAPGSPAEVNGLRVGDAVVSVDGDPATEADGFAVLDNIPGARYTTVVLGIMRRGMSGIEIVSAVRDEVNVRPVRWSWIPGIKVALVELQAFSDGVTDELAATIHSVERAGAIGMILDLRGNPGGLLDEAVSVAGLFLPGETPVVILEDRAGDRTTRSTAPESSPTRLPLVLLVDGDSASSSEILMGALLDAGRAEAVGTTTFGTGTSTVAYSFEDGSELHLGIERWLAPNGRSAWHIGLEPDVTVPMGADDAHASVDEIASARWAADALASDPQLRRAIDLVSAEVAH